MQALRAVAKLSTTILYIPLVSTTLELFNCVDTWELTGWHCYSGVHLVAVAVAATVTLAFSIFSFIGTCFLGLRTSLQQMYFNHATAADRMHASNVCHCFSWYRLSRGTVPRCRSVITITVRVSVRGTCSGRVILYS